MSGQNPIIPAPSRHRMISEYVRRVMAVEVNGTGVVYDNDERKIVFFFTEPRIDCDTTALSNLVKGTPVGPQVISAVISCGGSLPYDVEINTSTAGVDTVREAIQHFYPCEPDRDSRAALRSIYRQLTTHSAAREWMFR